MTPTEYVLAKLATRHGLDRMTAALRTVRKLVDQGEKALASAKRALEEAQTNREIPFAAYAAYAAYAYGAKVEAARRPESATEDRPRRCDGGAPGCTNKIAYYCGCTRCDSEPLEEAFFCCALHQHEASGKHLRMRGREAVWFVGNVKTREKYLGR